MRGEEKKTLHIYFSLRYENIDIVTNISNELKESFGRIHTPNELILMNFTAKINTKGSQRTLSLS